MSDDSRSAGCGGAIIGFFVGAILTLAFIVLATHLQLGWR